MSLRVTDPTRQLPDTNTAWPSHTLVLADLQYEAIHSKNPGCCIHRQSSWLLQRRSIRCLFTSHPSTSDNPQCCCPSGCWCWQIRTRHAMLHWLPVSQQIQFKIAISVFDCIREHCPTYFNNICIPVAGISGSANLRSAERHDMLVPSTRTQLGRRSFHVAAPAVWNALLSSQFKSWVENPSLHTGLYGHLWELLLKSVLIYITLHHKLFRVA